MSRSFFRIGMVAVCALVASPVFGGSISLQPRMGEPLDGLTAGELQRFVDGKDAFDHVFQEFEGLGPTFNKESCGNCHNSPVGGSGSQTVTRFGILDEKGGGFDPLEGLGGSLLQALTIDPVNCQEVIPPEANRTAIRVTPSALGFGLLEAIDDADLSANADPIDMDLDGVSGAVHMVQPLEDPMGPMRVGRFGWKAQVATVMTFSGDAGLNEMGITNDLVGTENAPNGNAAALAICDVVPDPEDVGAVGSRFIDKWTDFQRFLANPPQTPKSGMTGEALFIAIGCADCHITTYVTKNDMALEDVIRNQTIHPYSDFLLHNMGLLFDGIQQGTALPEEIRTPPLWGVRLRDPLLHDASIAGGAFATRVVLAIMDHGQNGSEAQPAVNDFMLVLSPAEQDQVVAFLDSLGRAEFDMDGDNDRDGEDLVEFMACFSGADVPYAVGNPMDDPCAISDLDQDGDVDCDDWQGFVAAFQADNGGASPPPLPACASTFFQVDIKPGNCPNSFNRNSNGVLPVAALGTAGFDATMIDVGSIVLYRADGVGGEVAPHEGPPGPHSTFEDVATPFEGETCDCHDLGGDGIVDLSLYFKTEDVVEALALDDLPAGALVELVVSGSLLDGTPFSGSDCIRLVPPGTPEALLSMTSNVSGAWVGVSPLDNTLDGGGFTDFMRNFPETTVVTLSAETFVNNKPLLGWVVDGQFIEADGAAPWLPSDTLKHTITAGKALSIEVIYGPPVKKQPQPGPSIGPGSGVGLGGGGAGKKGI